MPKEKLINNTRLTTALNKAKRYTDKAVSAITKFLPLTGGTMSNANLVKNLNAEYLGGKNLAWMYKNMTLDLTGLDQNTWYPVTIGPLSLNCGVYRFQIIALLDSETSPYKVDWATHKSGTFTARLVWESNGSGWGASLVKRRVHDFEFLFCKNDVSPIGGLSQMEHTSRELVYLRGGGKYYFTSQYDVAVTIHKISVTYNGETAAPVTTAPEAPKITASSTPEDYDKVKSNAQTALTVANNAAGKLNVIEMQALISSAPLMAIVPSTESVWEWSEVEGFIDPGRIIGYHIQEGTYYLIAEVLVYALNGSPSYCLAYAPTNSAMTGSISNGRARPKDNFVFRPIDYEQRHAGIKGDTIYLYQYLNGRLSKVYFPQ